MGGAHAVGLRVLAEAVSEVHASGDVQGRSALRRRADATPEELDALARVNQADVDEFRSGIEPLANAASSARCSRSFRRASRTRRPTREYSVAAAHVRGLSGRRRAAPQQLERRHRRNARALERVRRGVDTDRRAEVPILDPAELAAERDRASTTCACTAGTPRSGGRTTQAEDRYNYLYSADELQAVHRDRGAATALVKKAYLYLNNHFAAKSVANAVDVKHLARASRSTGDYPPELVERYP